MQLRTWIEEARKSLQEVSPNPGLDAQILLIHELGKDKIWILAHPNDELDSKQITSLQSQIGKAKQGEPIPYLIGHWEFYALDFLISPDVLIPRPETEMMVDMALERLKKQENHLRVLDMGTGTGCIAIALALHSKNSSIVGTDSSGKAIDIARKNAEKFHVENRVQLQLSNLFVKVEGKFDIICANLPYIATSELASLPVSKFEPLAALDGGEDGLTIISAFLKDAGKFMNHPGLILCEHGIRQADKIIKMAENHFPNSIHQTHKDLQGIPRLLSIKV
jgi:release factor glutamine methyltransferase